MKQRYKGLCAAVILASASIAYTSSNSKCESTACFMPRSQSRDKTRQMVGSVGHTHLIDQEPWYGTFSVLFEYTQSFKPDRIAECLFGCCSIDGCNCNGKTIKIEGSEVTDRSANAWLADYFYLPRDFQGTISFEPRIKNFLVDFDFYIGLDELWPTDVQGTYFRLYGPIVHTKWDLNFCESVVSTGTQAHPEGYFWQDEIPRSTLLNSFADYACGTQEITSIDGLTLQPLKFARMAKCDRTETGFADLRAELGWNIWQDSDYHVGINIQAAAPTGNKKQACFLFDALVGNGHHWELGAGITAHWVFWRSEDDTRHAGFYFDLNATHLFGARQQRTFDLCCKPNSRYMLAQRLDQPVKDLRATNLNGDDDSTNVKPSAQFKNEYAPVANISTMHVRVNVPIQGDVVAMFNYTRDKWSFDLGYNFWGRSCEKISCVTCDLDCNNCPSICDPVQKDSWALKGDARVYGFKNNATDPAALSATESKATICSGTNAKDTRDNAKLRNFGVDNAQFALFYNSGTDPLNYAKNQTGADKQIKTSLDPVFLHCEDVNLKGTRGISHKVFAHLQYNWEEGDWESWEKWAPYIGIGGFGEFGKTDSCCCTNSCNSCTASSTVCNTCCDANCDPCRSCLDCALSQWGVWVKCGLSFNTN